jgi:hypothetical protein
MLIKFCCLNKIIPRLDKPHWAKNDAVQCYTVTKTSPKFSWRKTCNHIGDMDKAALYPNPLYNDGLMCKRACVCKCPCTGVGVHHAGYFPYIIWKMYTHVAYSCEQNLQIRHIIRVCQSFRNTSSSEQKVRFKVYSFSIIPAWYTRLPTALWGSHYNLVLTVKIPKLETYLSCKLSVLLGLIYSHWLGEVPL